MRGPIADAIRRIEDRIGDERYWTKGRTRRFRGDGTTAFCLWGAELEDGANTGISAFLEHLARCFTDGKCSNEVVLNDRSTHADVMLFLATALDVAEAEGL